MQRDRTLIEGGKKLLQFKLKMNFNIGNSLWDFLLAKIEIILRKSFGRSK